MDNRDYFIAVFKKAEKKFGASSKRLAADDWAEDWQTLIATIMSAQTRDEVTIPVAEALFEQYASLKSLADARYEDVVRIIKRVNYSRVKAKHVIAAARYILEHFKGTIPDTLDALIEIPGVGRKTANLVIIECHAKDGICVDTHVHRIANVLGLVTTRTPHQTEVALMNVAPKRYWSRINRIFVLWGKSVPGRDKNRLLKALDN